MKKYLKWFAIISCTALAGVALWLYLGFFGNPVSKILCKNSAEKYVAQNYPDCYVDRRGYNFKDGSYFANIQKEGSPDTNFFVYTDWLGNISYDAYESYVTSGHNTANRMMMEYRDLLEDAIPQKDVEYTLDIFYGDILNDYYGKEFHNLNGYNAVYMPQEEIILDKQYDYSDIGYKYGYVCLYVCDEDVSASRAAEILLDVKSRLDNQNIGFYCIDFVLQLPRKTDGSPNDDETRINIDYFLWDDIYADGLEERVQSAHDDLTAYYAKLDAE
ncbi:MAG: hypothetical protein J6Q18_02205, partial [Oscillospiraceae bacterium]|nr:hypothetical protein [Oscillospiraceae bacterium]